MASAVATETENVTEQQSFVMLRNLARITYSTVLCTRSCDKGGRRTPHAPRMRARALASFAPCSFD